MLGNLLQGHTKSIRNGRIMLFLVAPYKPDEAWEFRNFKHPH